MTGTLARRPLMAELLARRADSLIVSGLGSATWDCAAAGDSAAFLYSWGGMGLAAPTALGLALAQPRRRVVCVTGDGEILMGIGALAVIADQAPDNLSILVLDNEMFGETGRQRGLTANRTDLAAVATAFGFARTLIVREPGRVGELARFLFETPGPGLAVVKVAVTDDPWSLPEKDGVVIAHRFRSALGLRS